jgi:hypothetical protein
MTLLHSLLWCAGIDWRHPAASRDDALTAVDKPAQTQRTVYP